MVDSLLKKIPHLTVTINGGIGFYKYNHGAQEEGVIAKCNSESFARFMLRIVDNEPNSYDEFWKALP